MVQCMTPVATEGGKVAVGLEVDGEGVWEGGEAYAYEAGASVQGIRPSSGSGHEGHTVTVTGRHFSNTAGLACRVGMGGGDASARWLSSTSVACVVPAMEGGRGRAQNVTVDVSNNGADFSEAGGGARFRYAGGSGWSVASMTPSWGPSGGGAVVTVVGSAYCLRDLPNPTHHEPLAAEVAVPLATEAAEAAVVLPVALSAARTGT